MPREQSVTDTYLHGSLLETIENALTRLGKHPDTVTITDLGPVDEFHIGGRIATERFLKQLNFAGDSHILDIGCGLGGTARFIADNYGARVTGIDLNPEYVETGNILCEWVGLSEQIVLEQGSANSLPYPDGHFDGACLLHVGMNIADKARLFQELARVLRPGALLGVYDVMRQRQGELVYPVPWADTESTSFLASPGQYQQSLGDAGFVLRDECNRRDFALEFFQQLKAKGKSAGGPPALGLHTLMQEATGTKITNMIANISANLIAPVEMVAEMPGSRA